MSEDSGTHRIATGRSSNASAPRDRADAGSDSPAHRLLREVRRSRPKLDPDKIRRDVLELHHKGAAPRYPVALASDIRKPGRVAAALAVAAVLVLALGAVLNTSRPGTQVSENGQPTSVAPTAEVERSSIRAEQLEAGALLKSKDQPLRVRHAGRATWTLSEGSEARLLENGAVIVVRLHAGSLEANVTHSPKPESFVVLAADRRIAVHGTRFEVRLTPDELTIQVREGRVAVAAIDQKASAQFLNAPSSWSVAITEPSRGPSDATIAHGPSRPSTD